MPPLPTIGHTLQQLFTTEATRLARETGLVQRNSKLTGPLILLILVAGFIQHPTASYNILAKSPPTMGSPSPAKVSKVALPAGLAAEYPGTGGDGPAAGIKWQVLWEIPGGRADGYSANCTPS